MEYCFSKHFLWLLFSIFIASLPMPCMAAEIDPRLLEDTEGGKTARFLVILKSQQPKSAAHSARDMQREVSVRIAATYTVQRDIRAELKKLNIPHRAFWIINALAVEGDRSLVEELAARDDVQRIETDRPVKVELEKPESGISQITLAPNAIEWNISKINAPYLWNLGFTGQGMIYANADTGVQWDHPALKAHYLG
jgi:hypothetical protein